MMKTRWAALVGTWCVCSLGASLAFATTITFEGASNADIPENYGSNAAVDGPGILAADSLGATPDVALTWFPAGSTGAEVWEFHNTTNFAVGNMVPAVAQLDVDGSVQPGGIPPEDPTIAFSVPANVGLILGSLDIGQALDQTEPSYAWTINIKRMSDDVVVFSHTTPVMGAGDSDAVSFNFVGDVGTSYYLHFDDGGANTVRGGIDNLSFGQRAVPEPTALCLGAVALASAARRRRNAR
ncbi:MAG: hypothetical protein KDA61_01940 [Planctomycetales bacterium]|nr:hypothetical protein [Planctomycetales bacterium]